MNTDRMKKILSRITIDGLMLMIVALMLLPFCWVISTSLRLPKESFTLPPAFFPTSFHFENYGRVFELVPEFADFIKNSVFVSVTATGLQIITTTMAAYAFARIEFWGRNVLFLIILSGLMIPVHSTIIPLFLIMRSLGLVDSVWSVILPYSINPLGIFLVRQFMLSIPKTLDEAAYLDGAGRFRIFWEIMIPMVKPATIVSSVLWFLKSWNDFFYPFIFLSTWEKMTLPVGLTVLAGIESRANPVSVVLAGVTLSLIAPVMIFIFGQKYLVQGSALSGLKG
ncbi:MAG: carbohydrate ABC transporter permease [bacterium]|nr:carbohydrate ABC transporter permease [bacterium]